MREIKFRAWDKDNEKIINSNQILHIEFEKEITKWIGYWYPETDEEGDWVQATAQCFNFELMQFTGLKDKNGKEIYEGDILHITTPDMVNLNYKTVVEWTDRGFYKDFTNYSMSEIIGNIYSNPELL